VLIIVGREHEGLYQGLKARQEAKGKDRVILDRRSAERRQRGAVRPKGERRHGDRRVPLSDAEDALMKVLGFTVLQREVSVLSGDRPPRKPLARRAARRTATGIPERLRKRSAS
jgi:hypothetical protein